MYNIPTITHPKEFFNILEKLSEGTEGSSTSTLQEIALNTLSNNTLHQSIISDGGQYASMIASLSKKSQMESLQPALITLFKEITANEEQELRKRDGFMWECINRTKDEKSGGYIYTFRFRNEYRFAGEAMYRKQLEIYPAIEPDAQAVYDLFIYRGNDEEIPLNELFKELGFSVLEEGYILIIPDREVLISRWKEAQLKYPNLPDLDVASSEGIANDMEFVKNYLLRDATISLGREFVHDALAHIVSIIIEMVTGKDKNNYSATRANSVKVIKGLYDIIKKANKNADKIGITKDEVEKMEVTLGWLTDTHLGSGAATLSLLLKEGNEKFPTLTWKEMVNNTSKETQLSSFWHRRFPKETKPDLVEMQQTWDKIMNFQKAA